MDFPATSGSDPLHREQVAALLRFQVPHSGQNTSGPELEADEVVRRPRPGELDIHEQVSLPLGIH